MEEEKLLPPGEPAAEPSEPFPQVIITETTPEAPKAPLPGVPSPQQQSWGVVISIIIIVLMITIGAFYAWGQRIAQNRVPAASSAQQ